MITTETTPLPKLIWVTDTHLDHIDRGIGHFANRAPIERFLKALNSQEPGNEKVLLMTGDISNAVHIAEHLQYLDSNLSPEYKRILFVLGNHDFYGGSFAAVEKAVRNVCSVSGTRLVYLSDHLFIPLTDDLAVVGHDGWYDGGYADWFAPGVVEMNDYYVIRDFLGKTRLGIHSILQQKAQKGANCIRAGIEAAIASGHKKIVSLTHVPPFRENSVYNGKISDNNWLPNFSSKVIGDCLLDISSKNPDLRFWSLCGHSHGKACVKKGKNLLSITGEAEYKYPDQYIHQLTIKPWQA